MKALREKLPELQVLPHLISSSIFRQELINAEFLSGIASLAQCGVETKLASGLGELLWRNFLDAIVSVLEVVCARPELLATHADILVTNSYPLLIHVLITDKQSGSKLLYIKLINDLLEVAIEKGEQDNEQIALHLSDEKKMALIDEIPSLLLNEAPLPVFSLRLFYQLIMASYEDYVDLVPKSGIIEVLITFVEMQSTEQSNQMLQRQLYPLLSLIWEKGHLDTLFLLLENDFVPLLVAYTMNSKTDEVVEYELKEMIYVLLNKVVTCVSDHVKSALKAKSRNAPLQIIDESDKRANYLLKYCRPITEAIAFILENLDATKDEEELITCASSTVSLMVHMWGGDGLNNQLDNVDRLLDSLSRRNQRLILKG